MSRFYWTHHHNNDWIFDIWTPHLNLIITFFDISRGDEIRCKENRTNIIKTFAQWDFFSKVKYALVISLLLNPNWWWSYLSLRNCYIIMLGTRYVYVCQSLHFRLRVKSCDKRNNTYRKWTKVDEKSWRESSVVEK